MTNSGDVRYIKPQEWYTANPSADKTKQGKNQFLSDNYSLFANASSLNDYNFITSLAEDIALSNAQHEALWEMWKGDLEVVTPTKKEDVKKHTVTIDGNTMQSGDTAVKLNADGFGSYALLADQGLNLNARFQKDGNKTFMDKSSMFVSTGKLTFEASNGEVLFNGQKLTEGKGSLGDGNNYEIKKNADGTSELTITTKEGYTIKQKTTQSDDVSYRGIEMEITNPDKGISSDGIKAGGLLSTLLDDDTTNDTTETKLSDANSNYAIALDSFLNEDDSQKIEMKDVKQGTGKAWGDPHFAFNGLHAADFHGEDGKEYKMLDNKDMSMNAKFKKSGSYAFITDQHIELKGQDGKALYHIVTHQGGNVEIKDASGKTVATQADLNDATKLKELQTALKTAGIELDWKQNGSYKTLKTTHQGRTMTQDIYSGMINVSGDIRSTDNGLLNQTVGALDEKDGEKDGKLTGVDTNRDGVVNDQDIVIYNKNKQYFVNEGKWNNTTSFTGGGHTVQDLTSVKEAIRKDVESAVAKGIPVFAACNTNNGYTEAQWNEYVGQYFFGVEDSLI